jgi:hypothetical protein
MAEQMTGQITVGTAGTAVQGPSTPSGIEFVIKGHPGNAGSVAFGNDGSDDVTMDNGYVLAAGDEVRATFFGGADNALSAMYFDVANNGDKFCWIKVR